MTSPLFAALSALMLTIALPQAALAQEAAADAAPTEQNISAQETPWQVNCTPGAEASQLDCSMVKSLVIGQNRQVLAQAAIVAGDPYVLRILVPHGMSLAAGLRVSVDGVEAATPVFRTSLQGGALAVSDVSAELEEALRAGGLLQIEGVQNNGSALRMEMSLSGFAAAFDKLR
ncbi:invasion associated locus B family protein [Tabrizicola aquatica]|uniref:invasion associated locus B family protein n=1 Tax=Tabrizicola aquatica TaxID=909926 RepID=UPI000CD1FAFE|nr:invasion associated locus B family protein [Tabrizicola aquatica]